jgi:hypothetical protein
MSAQASRSQTKIRCSVKLPFSATWLKLTISLAKERNPTKESIDERLRKRKRRAVTVRAADVGKEAQDMRLPSEENYKTKKVGSPQR